MSSVGSNRELREEVIPSIQAGVDGREIELPELALKCLCFEQGLGWILFRDAFLPQLVCVFCIKKLGIPHLNCYLPMKNKYQCLRIPKHFTAFYFSVGTARSVMPMAREVINYPILQQMI